MLSKEYLNFLTLEYTIPLAVFGAANYRILKPRKFRCWNTNSITAKRYFVNKFLVSKTNLIQWKRNPKIQRINQKRI